VHGPVIFSPPTKGGQSGRGMVDPKGRASWLQSHDKVDTLCVWPETTALGQKMQKAMQENAENSHANIQSFDFV